MNVLDNALGDLTLQILEGVKIGNYSAFETADQNISSGYYVVKWTLEPYTLQLNNQLGDCIPPVTVHADEFVANAQYMNYVAKSKLLYTYPKTKDEQSKKISVALLTDSRNRLKSLIQFWYVHFIMMI